MTDRRALHQLIDAIVGGDDTGAMRQLKAAPALATLAYGDDGKRGEAPSVFFERIVHYMYGGDTALHLAAAAFRPAMIGPLVAAGADVRAKNRRGAEPLHYAADANRTLPEAQADTIARLIAAGADPNAVDRSGVAPLHRAVRTRSVAAVRVLIDGGADVNQRNGSGSTPLLIARSNTGRSGNSSPEALEARAAIQALLIARGAKEETRRR